jgi:hypothetical protein
MPTTDVKSSDIWFEPSCLQFSKQYRFNEKYRYRHYTIPGAPSRTFFAGWYKKMQSLAAKGAWYTHSLKHKEDYQCGEGAEISVAKHTRGRKKFWWGREKQEPNFCRNYLKRAEKGWDFLRFSIP